MRTLQFRKGRIRMFDIKAFINLFLGKSASVLIVFLCLLFFYGCVDVTGPEINFPDIFPGSGFKDINPDFMVEKTYQAEFPVGNQIRVNVEAINGEVMVTGQIDADSVLVTAYLSVSSDSHQDAEIHIDDLQIQATKIENEILLQTVQPKNSAGRQYIVEYDIIVPLDFEVVTTQVNGSIMISGIENNVDVSNTNGDVTLTNIFGGVTAGVVNGSIEGTVVLPVGETVDLFADNGSLKLLIPTSTSADFSAHVGINGSISDSNLDITDSMRTNHLLTGAIGNGEGSIELGTVNGNIEVIGFNDA